MEIARFFFQLTNQVKLYHWQTKSYARHIATDTLHTVLLPLVDRFMEVYQGKVGARVSDESKKIPLSVSQLSDAEMESFLEKAVEYLQDLAMLRNGANSDLANIRDDIVGNINQTLYLFSFK